LLSQFGLKLQLLFINNFFIKFFNKILCFLLKKYLFLYKKGIFIRQNNVSKEEKYFYNLEKIKINHNFSEKTTRNISEKVLTQKSGHFYT